MDVELVNPDQVTTRSAPKKTKFVKSFIVFSLVTIGIVVATAIKYEKLDIRSSRISNLRIVLSQVKMLQKPMVEQEEKSIEEGEKYWLSRAEIRKATDEPWRDGKPSLQAAVREYVNKNKDFTIKPDDIKFLDTANPCWRRGTTSRTSTTRRYCLPYFYILAFSKCATTDMYVKLLSHPKVSSTCDKEPHWWARYRFMQSSKRRSFLQYLSCFSKLAKRTDPSSTELIIATIMWTVGQARAELEVDDSYNREQDGGDGSPDNLWGNTKIISESASKFSGILSELTREAIQDYRLLPVHLIHQFTPQARYIISMREPGERLYSDYLHMMFNTRGGKRKASPSHFHTGVLEQIRLYKECLKKQNPRFCAYDESVRNDQYASRVRLWVGLYVVYLKDMFSLVAREQVKLIYFNDYISNRTGVLAETLAFLGLETSPTKLMRMDIGIANPRRQVFKEKMWESTREMLNEFYRPFNLELASLLKSDKYRFDYDPS